jgi:hypothetical protein
MKKPVSIIQTTYSIEHPDTYWNFMVLVFMADNEVLASHVFRFPDWFVFWDMKYRYYNFSHN